MYQLGPSLGYRREGCNLAYLWPLHSKCDLCAGSCICITSGLACVQSNLGESEKRFKALKETVQQSAAALPFLAPQDSSTQVRKLSQTTGKAIGKVCMQALYLVYHGALLNVLQQPMGHCLTVMLCYAVLCYAMLCCGMLCYAALCCAVLCCAVLCHVMLCHAMGKAQLLLKRRSQSYQLHKRMQLCCTCMILH